MPHSDCRCAAFILAAFTLFFPTASRCADNTTSSKPNILLIISDDLNDWIGPMGGHPQTQTPNLDKLASKGMMFRNAQCAAPLCNPSRTAFLSGMRPSTTGIYHNQQPWMPHIGPGKCLNDYIRTVGYQSLGAGKIYHYKQYREAEWDKVVFPTDDTLPKHPAKRSPGPFGYRMFTDGEPQKPSEEKRAESKLVDAQSVSWCIDRLGDANAPFFMACGIHRPHTPFDVPKKYFDRFPLESIKLPKILETDLDDVPQQGKDFATTSGASEGVHARIKRLGLWKDRVRAYLANVCYMDAQVGRLLDALEKSAHHKNTIIVFVGDHGWHLGEKEHWAKVTLWSEATRVPFIWVVPGMTEAGSQCDRPVDMMSIYPTVCELAGASVPNHVEGLSIKPLLKNPKAEWTTPSLCTMHRGNHTLLTEDWRYIHYADGTEELYNQKTDRNEWTNVAAKPEFADVKKQLAKYLPVKNAEPVAEKLEAAKKPKKKPAEPSEE
ncbi:MAG: sulfatase [Candidatus Sumerlaeaceae bacterium]